MTGDWYRLVHEEDCTYLENAEGQVYICVLRDALCLTDVNVTKVVKGMFIPELDLVGFLHDDGIHWESTLHK